MIELVYKGELSEYDKRIIAVLINEGTAFYIHRADCIYPFSEEELMSDYEDAIEDEFMHETPSFDDWLSDTQMSVQELLNYEWDQQEKTIGDYYVMTIDEVDEVYQQYLDRICDDFEEEVHHVLYDHFSSKRNGKSNNDSNVPFYFPLNRAVYRRDLEMESSYYMAVTGNENSKEDMVQYKDKQGCEYKFYIYNK